MADRGPHKLRLPLRPVVIITALHPMRSQPGHCGCEVCERLYTECRQEAGKILAEYHFNDFYEASRWIGSGRSPMSDSPPRRGFECGI